MNVSATLNVLRLFVSPSLCLPQMKVATFNDLRFPLKHEIKAVVLDKDNCFAQNHQDRVWGEYEKNWLDMKEKYPGAALLIVSNSAGTNDDPGHRQALALEKNTGIPVLRHATKKPGCYGDILEYFYAKKVITLSSQVAIVGDRLFTDILMANMMGSYGVWLDQGVFKSNSLICKIERWVYLFLT